MKKGLITIGLGIIFLILAACVEPVVTPRASLIGDAALIEIASRNTVVSDLQHQISTYAYIATDESYTRTPTPTAPSTEAVHITLNKKLKDDLEIAFDIEHTVKSVEVSTLSATNEYEDIKITIVCSGPAIDECLSQQTVVDFIRALQANKMEVANMIAPKNDLVLCLEDQINALPQKVFTIRWKTVTKYYDGKITADELRAEVKEKQNCPTQ